VRDFLTLVIFAIMWVVCGRSQLSHESVTPVLPLSPTNVVNPLKLNSQETSYESTLLHTLYSLTSI